jgi:hypothetical protein
VNVETHNESNQILLPPEASNAAFALVSTADGGSVESNKMTPLIEAKLRQRNVELTAERDQLRAVAIKLVAMRDALKPGQGLFDMSTTELRDCIAAARAALNGGAK